MYKYTKIQGPRYQRNYIIARDQRSDLHGTSFQSLPKINSMLITRPFAYSESLQHLIIAVLLIKILIFFRPLSSVYFLSKEIMSKMPFLLLYRNHYFCLYLFIHRMIGLMRSPQGGGGKLTRGILGDRVTGRISRAWSCHEFQLRKNFKFSETDIFLLQFDQIYIFHIFSDYWYICKLSVSQECFSAALVDQGISQFNSY